ncbi:unnamed protein product [Rotaria magnacalcarata]|uniref:Plus3 domain-containing protein n=1 Tax=Rotaria magnacalcarata TaxID=392030 RepID=A0A819PIA9_9BILA|nr:unnamed protein product [Rotaria magnacalcarata]
MSKFDSRKRHRTTSGNSDSDSDSDSSQSKKIFTDGYDENYRGDSNDRAWLKTLSEREREAELLKRHEQREIIKRREEINKRLKSKAEESGIKSEEEGEIDEHDDDDESDHDKTSDHSTRKSNLFDNDIYAEDDDDDDYRKLTNRRQQINATKQKETEHSKSLQILVEGRKKRQDDKHRKSVVKSDDVSSSDEDSPVKPTKTNNKDEIWKVDDVFPTSSSDDDDDDDSRGDSHHRRRSRSPDDRTSDSQEQETKRKKCTFISTRDQLKSMILSRFRMEKWCHSPFFADVAKGAFVRINIGQNNGEAVYRVCEIRDVVETGKIYNLGTTRTNKGLRLKHGTNERIFRLEYVSNNEISDEEFQRWREAMIKQGISLPTLDDLEKKINEIEKYKHYVYNNTDITKIVQEKKRFRKAPINYAVTKNELLKEIEIAKDENDTERENELRKQLTEMEERASELDRKRSENISVMAFRCKNNNCEDCQRIISKDESIGSYAIPNIVHFITSQGDASEAVLKKFGPRLGYRRMERAPDEFQLINYLVLLSARNQIKPDQLYVHYSFEPTGYWWTKAKQDLELNLTLNKIPPITSIYNHPLYHHAHRTDIARLEILDKYGGIYLDLDVLSLKSFSSLTSNPHHAEAIFAWERKKFNTICNAVIIAPIHSKFLRRIYHSYQSFNSSCWGCHSVSLPGQLANIYINEVHILPSRAFFTPSWSNIEELYLYNRYNFKNNYASHLWNSYREAQEPRNSAADPFTRRRCAPMLVTQTPVINSAEDLKRETERREAQTKKKNEEQRSTNEKNKLLITKDTTTKITTHNRADKPHTEKSFTMTTGERGSFTSFSEHSDEMFASHDFELDLNIKLFPD